MFLAQQEFLTGNINISLNKLINDSVKLNSNATALSFNGVSLTYSELNAKANRLAALLIEKGIKVNSKIALTTERSVDVIIVLLAIIKTGSAYVPIDISYPSERVTFILDNSEAYFFMICRKHEAKYANLSSKTLFIEDAIRDSAGFPDENLDIETQKNSLIYILHTSGSTGIPKGVCMGQMALINLLLWQKEHSLAGFGTKTLQFSPLSFDVSFQEIFATLTTGGQLVLISEDYRLDAHMLLKLIDGQKVNRIFLPFVALQSLTETAVVNNIYPQSLIEVMTAGEQLKVTPQVVSFFTNIPGSVLFNQYGPTEAHVVTELKLTGSPAAWPALPNIGKAIFNTEILILDEQLNKVANGEIGELCISGVCLANGYLNLPDLTSEKFVFLPESRTRIYRTGDLAQILSDGNIEFLGRKDLQVKIRGHRVELGEIEVAVAHHPDISQVAVLLREDLPGRQILVAYVIGEEKNLETNGLKDWLAKSLPEYMLPDSFIWLNAFPKTTSGKIDRKLLPKPELKRPQTNVIFKKPSTIIEIEIENVFKSIFGYDSIGLEDNFFEIGGNSLLAQKAVAAIKSSLGYNIPVTKLYQFPTISGIVNSLEKTTTRRNYGNVDDFSSSSKDIAVIGMSARFPGANTIEEFWSLLIEGRESVTFFSTAELDESVDEELKNDPAYVKARGIIANADLFDASFFGINPKLAELMDPQQRIFLEISYEVLEKTGNLSSDKKIGVFAGAGNNTYYENNVLQHPDLINNLGKIQVLSVNDKDYIASRTAYHLNLKGPAVSVNSACSTSLLAIASAVNSLRANQCELAIAGGSSITAPIKSGHIYQEGSMLSSDGHSKPFDDQSTGTVFSDGTGAVLLKRLDDAIRDGDKIISVIKGVGVNNDGFGKGSFSAPSSEGQSEAISSAIIDAGVHPAEISYVETHGTGTPIGDPIEFEGLVDAFGNQESNNFCAIGSVKSNFGHLTHAAGVAGFIKTSLALHHKKIPASLGFETPNRNINFKDSPFFVNDRLSDWAASGKRTAGVSSFGVGGTNVHVILEGYDNPTDEPTEKMPAELITWSANSEHSRERYGIALNSFLNSNPTTQLSDVAYTLQTTRKNFKYRQFIVANSTNHLTELLAQPDVINDKVVKELPQEIVFTFPGQGAQYVNMGIELYQQEPVYAAAIDECAGLLKKYLDTDIRSLIFVDEPSIEATEKLKDTKYTQPALFVTEYALAKLWMSWGITATLFCGHSIGEYVAAHLAGIFSLDDSLKLISARGKLISNLPVGAMLSVRESSEVVSKMLSADLSIAAINSPKSCVVAGPTEQIAELIKFLDKAEIANKELFTGHAFHSSMMDPILPEFEKIVAEVKLAAPNKKIVSTVTGKLLNDQEAQSVEYWTMHLRKTVFFSKAIETILEGDLPLFLEVGPGNVTSTLIKQVAAGHSTKVAAVSSLSFKETEYASMLNALGTMWINGISPNWSDFYAGQSRNIIDLPSYQFDKKRYWVDAKKQEPTPANFTQVTQADTPKNTTNMRKSNLTEKVKQILEDASGIEINNANFKANFLELGLDSLLLTQIAISLKKEFNLPITFRKLNEEYSSIDTLVDYLLINTADDEPVASYPVANYHQNAPNGSQFTEVQQNKMPAMVNDGALSLIAQQLEILSKQVILLQGGNINTTFQQVLPSEINKQPAKLEEKKPNDFSLSKEETAEIQKPFGATPKIERLSTELNAKQADFINNLTLRYNNKTAKSKSFTADSRAYMADPRVVSGFRPATKELIYPIVINKSAGSKLWDIDGNEYIDALNGFGSSMLGYQPEVIKAAMHEQIDKGYEVGPQHELAAEVSKLICEFTGFDRAALCSTGSEAVLGCIRIARTVTARSLIVAFTGSYHGIIDEVLVRGTKKLKSFPAAAGIMPEAVQNILVLDYGTDESLEIIKQRAAEIAAVLVEPVQSRRPEFVPIEFLKKVRQITLDEEIPLIFDEVITGFRMHPGGAQALFGIKADLASYGKVIGAGVPIGVIAGNRELMDALDGGHWEYGDQSYPEIGVTYFAGTFVRHPLALASAKASLNYMKEKGPALQEELNKKGAYLSKGINDAFEKRKLPIYVANYGSLWKVKYHEEIPYSELMFTLMREKGIHILDGFPCFITETLTYENIDTIVSCFIESMDEMIKADFFSSTNQLNGNFVADEVVVSADNPPVAGARLGKDKEGNPAWFIQDPNQNGKYLHVKLT
ncbi:type I polyketide synthase [Pedobacter sp. Leaf194]|uniref:type I polyketide synthase n=1 Tax=Pedobacter sp. Leaf194 TaxID=1736297 RepID=UPI00070326C7|nr:type I polyketide synthase [Pedobacter sp. Leaf194]KQS32326.1 peptide synthetase [Pedobacter sp. Leaf194]